MTVTASDQPACDTAAEMSQYLADAIRRALSHPVPLPRHEEVEEATEQLRDEVAGVRATVESGAAPRCTECRDIKAARRGAEQRGDREGMGVAAARMGVHQREVHA